MDLYPLSGKAASDDMATDSEVDNAIASHLAASNPHLITPTLIGAAPTSHTHTGAQITGNISGSAANITGIAAIANGGTGASTAAAALTNLGAAAAAHTHPYLSFSNADYPYFKDIEFHGSGNPLTWTFKFHPNTFWAIYIIEIRGGCHLGNRGAGGFVIKKGIIRNTESSYSVFNIEENYYGTFYAGIIAVTSTSTNLIITINYLFQIDGRFTLLVSGGGLNVIQASIKPF